MERRLMERDEAGTLGILEARPAEINTHAGWYNYRLRSVATETCGQLKRLKFSRTVCVY